MIDDGAPGSLVGYSIVDSGGPRSGQRACQCFRTVGQSPIPSSAPSFLPSVQAVGAWCYARSDMWDGDEGASVGRCALVVVLSTAA